MTSFFRTTLAVLAAAGMAAVAVPSSAAIVDVTVTIQNLSAADSLAFSPTNVAFHDGSFDVFDINAAAGAEIISIAEGGEGSAWRAAADAAGAEFGVITPPLGPPPVIPAGNVGTGPFASNASATFRIDTDVDGRFFTFANMVIPSNDLFLGNDNPLAFELLDSNGNLLLTDITQTAAQIWDANSEVANPLNGAFVADDGNGNPGVNGNRVAENGTIEFAFDELTAFNGVTTPAGYVVDTTGLAAGDPIFSLSFTATPVAAVPEPTSLLGLAAIGTVGWIRRRK